MRPRSGGLFADAVQLALFASYCLRTGFVCLLRRCRLSACACTVPVPPCRIMAWGRAHACARNSGWCFTAAVGWLKLSCLFRLSSVGQGEFVWEREGRLMLALSYRRLWDVIYVFSWLLATVASTWGQYSALDSAVTTRVFGLSCLRSLSRLAFAR